MGTVIGFPEQARTPRATKLMAARSESATVIILPVIRIERYTDEPRRAPRRRRRRRVTRN